MNITAGLDMSISEFEEVGDAIKALPQKIATVIVGTVIDPKMTDELRVTLLRPGLAEMQRPLVERRMQKCWPSLANEDSAKIRQSPVKNPRHRQTCRGDSRNVYGLSFPGYPSLSTPTGTHRGSRM